jgi:hypothetical protein
MASPHVKGSDLGAAELQHSTAPPLLVAEAENDNEAFLMSASSRRGWALSFLKHEDNGYQQQTDRYQHPKLLHICP